MGTTNSSQKNGGAARQQAPANRPSENRNTAPANTKSPASPPPPLTVEDVSVDTSAPAPASATDMSDSWFRFDGPSMNRAMTFDDRKMAAAEKRSFPVGPGMKKTVSFFGERSRPAQLDPPPSEHYEDVLFRRFFGDAPNRKRAESLVGLVPSAYDGPKAVAAERSQAVIVVDTFSTGAMLAYNLYHQGYKVICVLSGESVEKLLGIVPEGMDTQFVGTHVFDQKIDPAVALAKLVREVNSCGIPIAAVMAGAESGVELADALAEYLGLRTNGTAMSEARRNKFLMGEAVRAAGVRAVKQLYATKWSEIAAFLEEWKPDPFKVIVKPVDSAGSEDVTLCLSVEDCQKAFGNIIGKINGLGIMNKAVLVQEYLEGTEYIIDCVSRDGEHKVIGIWEYDRRLANGAPTVCFGYKLLSAEEPRCREMMDYMRKVIDALGIRHGPTHGEVKWFKDEPVLVEVGARCQGGEGLFVKIADEAFGYNQVDATIASYLCADDFAALPYEPTKRLKYGYMKWLCSFKEGHFNGYNADNVSEIISLSSYRGHQWFVKPGTYIHKTRNCFSWVGLVRLVNDDEAALQRDWDRLEEMQSSTLFEIDDVPEPASENKNASKCVAVVDPFTTGAVLAYHATLLGYKLIAVYSQELAKLDKLTKMVPKDIPLVFDGIVAFQAIDVMATAISSYGWEVAAVMAGAETGVELADALSEHMGLRTNGTALSEARRNKYLMGEAVRDAGIRAVKQLYTTKWSEIAAFLEEWKPDPFKVIVKPVDSAGSEDVTLCLSVEACYAAFNNIFGKINGLGLRNKAVLVQEYLEGTEYIIDSVSRDGEHKVIGIWEYDRRLANGAPTVCFGYKLISAAEPRCREMMDYMRKVIDALGIRHGPTHGEVKWFKDEPVLVEVGARCQGGDGFFVKVADEVTGHNQVDDTLACYLDEDRFATIPSEPIVLLKQGLIKAFCSYKEGILRKYNEENMAEILSMSSYRGHEMFIQPGACINKTRNLFTWVGLLRLVNDDPAALQLHWERVEELQNTTLYDVDEVIERTRSRTRSNAQDEEVFQDKASADAFSDFEKTTVSLLSPIMEETGRKNSPRKGSPTHAMVPLARDAEKRSLRVSFHTVDNSADSNNSSFKSTADYDGFIPLQKKVSFKRFDQSANDIKPENDGFVPLKKKSNTFVERRLASSIESFVHRKPLQKAVTFVATSHLKKTVVEANSSLGFDDVMYRRYFGEKPSLAKLPSLQGIVPVVYEKPNRTVELSTDKAVVIVDTFSTGANLACNLYHKGYKVICALSGKAVEKLLDMVAEGLDTQFTGTFIYDDDMAPGDALAKLAREVNSCGIPVVAVLAGAETGVELADALSEYMCLRTNGTTLSECRRNKFLMGEAVRAAGVRAVKQLYATKWSEIAAFLEEWKPDPFKVIVKPVDSAGSEDVTLCLSVEDCQRAFGNIIGKINGLGIKNVAVLVQEYLEGTEYIIDCVSRDGEHKVIGIWEYDRRAVNGAVTTCFGQRMLTADEPRCREMMDYMRKVIDALGIRHGPTHGEVKWFKDEPVLVEVGARCQGGEGLWIAVSNEALGYSQVDATIAAYTSEEDFRALPNEPVDRKMFGSLKWLCSMKEGPFKEYNPADVAEIQTMESYRGHQFFVAPGTSISKTRNCFTWVGCVRLAHENEETLKRNMLRLEEMERDTLFLLKEDVTNLSNSNASKCVAVVDPFSTGAIIAYNATKMGYKCIAVYSAGLEQLDALTSLVPAGLDLTFDGIVTCADKESMSTAIRKFGWEVAAVMAGAETGVELADALSEHMGLRTNGTTMSEARRNKYLMGETIRKAGLRAVKQQFVTKWSEVSDFLDSWNPEPFKVIVKPVDSAGSEDVTLCLSMNEVKIAFNSIVGKVNGLGLLNKSVLIQEYLEGTEYVVDTVSRDGIHKVVAIWEYDRRCINGASFVCFGQRLLSANEPRCREMISYMCSVISALGIVNGPSHGEVKWCKGEPVLVEVGARCHGAEGHWIPLADRALGCNQAWAASASYLDEAAFIAIPSAPLSLKTNGRMMFFVSTVSGTLSEINPTYVAEMQAMSSFVNFEMFLKVGGRVSKTINCFTFAGVVVLIHDELETVLSDGDRIRAMEDSGLFCIAE